MLLFFKNCVWFRRKEREEEVTHPPSLCLCVSFSVSYKDTVVGFWVPFQLILILTLITSAKLLLPNKVIFWVPGDMNIWETLFTHSACMLAQKLKNLPEMQETQVQSLHQEDPMQKAMATHSTILCWRSPWMEEPGRLYSLWGGKESDMTEQLTVSLFIHPQHTSFYTWYTAVLFDTELNKN